MKRRTFFHHTSRTLAGTAMISPALAPAAAAPGSSPFGFASAPVLFNPTAQSVELIIAVHGPATGWVEYGETEALGQRGTGEVNGFLPYEARALRFHLDGLQPGKTYYYRVHAVAVTFENSSKAVRGAEVKTEIRSFRTLNPAAETATFTVWNDTHENKETLRQLIAAHRSAPADFLFWNGDVTNNITTEQLVIDQFLAPAGEAYAESTPVFFTRGNHDVRGPSARLLSQYLPGPLGHYHYTIRQGPLACVVLDTGEDKPDATPSYGGLNDFSHSRAAQRQWLERAIEDPAFQSAPFRIALMHIPLWWDGQVPEKWPQVWGGFSGWICEEGRRHWHDLLEKAGIRLIISGHTHTPAWFPPRAEHAYAQFTGGGPRPETATITRVQATAKELRVTVSNLAGETLFQELFLA